MSVFKWIVILAGIFSATSCKEKAAQRDLIPDVNVVAAGQRAMPVYSEYVGQTLGETDVEIRPRVEGWVTGVYFKEGSSVRKGQLLYTIDDQPLRNQIDQANGQLAEANTRLVRDKNDLDRVRPLAEINALSKRDLDAAEANYKASKSEVSVAQAKLRNAHIELSYTRITAPLSGIIGISKVQVGDFVSPQASTPINTVSSLGDVRVRFSITENEYLKFIRRHTDSGQTRRPGEGRKVPIQLILSDGTPFPEPGTIDLANRQIDPETGSLLMQASFQNKSGLLRPGQYVKVKAMVEEVPDAVLVPQQAVNQMQNIFQVFVVNDSNKITPRIVQPGIRVGRNWIITDGLKAGEKVAMIGNAVIKPNSVIKPVLMAWDYDSTVSR
jgi:membrane fusion protein, multidrug efflux system